jgi:hypothetical protein
MTSNRKFESNKKNASLSTGPRSQVGKLRSKMNAFRHGLATCLNDIPEQSDKLERLAAILSEGSDDLRVAQEARVIAECHLDLQRIRVVQRGAFLEISKAQTIEDLKSPIAEITKIGRYSRRAVSRRKTALNSLTPKQE